MMKKIQRLWVTLLVCFLLLAVVSTAFAAKQKIRVGYFRFPGYHEIAEDGRYFGYGYDVLQMLRFYNDWEYEYVGYDKNWEDMLEMLEKGEIDMVTSARRTPEREEKFLFSSIPIGIKATRLSVRDDDARYSPDVFSTYNGMRIATVSGSSQNEVFVDFAKQHGFSYTLIPFENTEKLERVLKEDKSIDAILTSNVRYMHNERVLNQFSHQPFYVIVRKDKPQLIEQVDAALENMNETNPLWFNTLWYKYYNYPLESEDGKLILSEREIAYLKEQDKNKVYTVMVGVGHSPYSYMQNGEINGVLPDIFHEVATRAGIKYKLIPVHGYVDYKAHLEKGEADFILDMPQDEYLAEKAGYRLSVPLLKTAQFLVQRHRDVNADGKLAAVRAKKMSRQFQKLAQQYKVVEYFDSYEECLAAVEKFECDATYLDALQAQEAISNDYKRQLVMTMEPDAELSYTVAMSGRIDPLLRTILNKAIASTSADYSNKVVAQYLLQNNRKVSLMSLLYDNPMLGIFIVLIICALCTFIIVMYIRQKNLRIIEKQNKELREKQQQLSEALSKAELANKAKTGFLNNMSHDIRTPMNSIMGFTAIALEEVAPNSAVKNYLEKINASGQHLLSLINDILDMGRIDSGKLEVKPAPCNIIELLHGLKTIVQGSLEEKKLRFAIDTSSLDNQNVLCDKLLLQRALLNCVSNAIKYTQPGGSIILQAEQRKLEDDMVQYTLRLCDNGIGISKEFLQHIYEIFARERNATVSGIKGSGLGMAITKNILTLMGGTIEIKSEKNLGTEVIIRLTLPITHKAEQAAATELTAEQLAIFKGRHVLLVDDVQLNCEIASLILRRAGLKVTVLHDGLDAVSYMQKAKAGDVDLILMDLMMPVLDGFEATRQIRRLPDQAVAAVPIVALTASAFEENKKEALAAGMNGHVAKPISLESLYEELKKYFT